MDADRAGMQTEEDRQLRICLLGGMRVFTGDTPLPPFPTQKSRSLFAYLLLNRTRTLTRSHLAGVFWGDSPESRARRSLNITLWRLRRLDPQQRPGARGIRATLDRKQPGAVSPAAGYLCPTGSCAHLAANTFDLSTSGGRRQPLMPPYVGGRVSNENSAAQRRMTRDRVGCITHPVSTQRLKLSLDQRIYNSTAKTSVFRICLMGWKRPVRPASAPAAHGCLRLCLINSTQTRSHRAIATWRSTSVETEACYRKCVETHCNRTANPFQWISHNRCRIDSAGTRLPNPTSTSCLTGGCASHFWK